MARIHVRDFKRPQSRMGKRRNRRLETGLVVLSTARGWLPNHAMRRISWELHRELCSECFRTWLWIPTTCTDSQACIANTLLAGTRPSGWSTSMNQGNEKRVKTFPYVERLSSASGLRVENRTQHAPEICHFMKRLTWTLSASLVATLGVRNNPCGDAHHTCRVFLNATCRTVVSHRRHCRW
jgi:hypothetical protein